MHVHGATNSCMRDLRVHSIILMIIVEEEQLRMAVHLKLILLADACPAAGLFMYVSLECALIGLHT